MIFVFSALVMTAALFLVLAVSRLIERPDAPQWLQRACRTNAMALFATVLFAIGMGGALQAAFEGGLHGLGALGLTLAAPFVLLWLGAKIVRRSGAEVLEMPTRPDGSRPRTSRTGAAPAADRRRRIDRAA